MKKSINTMICITFASIFALFTFGCAKEKQEVKKEEDKAKQWIKKEENKINKKVN